MIDKHRNVLQVSLKLVIPNFAPFEVERLQLSEIPLRCFRLTVKTLGFATELLPVFSSLNILWQSYKFFRSSINFKVLLILETKLFHKDNDLHTNIYKSCAREISLQSTLSSSLSS